MTMFLILFIIGCLCTTATNPAPDPDIVLGGLFPVHKNQDGSCGEVLDLGIQRLEAMVLAVHLVNEDPDLLPGLKLGFDIRDTCTQPNRALQSSLDFVLGLNSSGTALNETQVTYSHRGFNSSAIGISGVVGSASSSESISAASLLRLFFTPQISYASTARILSDKTRYEYFLRTLPPDLYQAKVMVELVLHYNWTYIVAINSDDVYGREGIAAFVGELQSIATDNNQTDTNTTCQKTFCTTSVPISVSVTATDDDFDDIVKLINEPWISNASVVVMFGQLSTAEGLFKAIKRYPSHRPLTFLMSDAVGNNLHPVFYSTYHTLITVVPEYRESEEFDKYFTSLKPTGSSNPWFTEYWESVFGCTFNNSLHNQRVPNLPMCDDSKQSLKNSSYKQNSKVPFVMDAVLAFAHAIHDLLTDVCDGIVLCKKVVIKRFGKTVINGEMLLKYLLRVNFKGFSADEIDFDVNGDQAGGYWIDNLQYSSDKFKFVRIAEWSKYTSLVHTDEPISWEINETISICSEPCTVGHYPVVVESQSACCWECEPCRSDREVSDGTECIVCEEGYSPDETKSMCKINPLTYLKWVNPMSWAAILLSLIGLAGTVTTALVFLICYDHSTVKASSRELSAISLTGLFLCFSISLVSIGKPHPVTCGISRFLFGFAFSLCYAALLVKTNRIHRIFNNKSNITQRPPMISPQSQILFTMLFVFIQVVISGAWLLLERPGIKSSYQDDHTEVVCSDTPYIGVIVSLAYNIILLIITMAYAFRSRKIPENFNEARFIFVNVCILFIIWLAFIPLYLSLSGIASLSYTYLSFLEFIAIDLSALSSLFFLYFPKLYSIFTGGNGETSDKSNGHNSSTIDKKPLRIGSLNGYSSNIVGTSIGKSAAYLKRSNTLPIKSTKAFHLNTTTQVSSSIVLFPNKVRDKNATVNLDEQKAITDPSLNNSNVVDVTVDRGSCSVADSVATDGCHAVETTEAEGHANLSCKYSNGSLASIKGDEVP